MRSREPVPAGNQFTLWAFPPYATGTFPPSSTAFNSRQQLYSNKYNNIYNNISTMIEGTCSCYDIDIYKYTTIVNDVNPFPSEHVPVETRSRWNTFPPSSGNPFTLEFVPAGTRSRRGSGTRSRRPLGTRSCRSTFPACTRSRRLPGTRSRGACPHRGH